MTTWHAATIGVGDLSIHYWRTGTPGKPIVLCAHGLTDAGKCWQLFADTLAAEYEFVLPDARGHGKTSAPNTGYRTDDLAADAYALIDALKLEQVIGIGHSMGGTMIALLAAQHPDRVRAAILEDPAFRPNGYTAADADRMAAGLQAEQLVSYEDLIAQAKRNTPDWDVRVLDNWALAKSQVRPQVFNWMREQATPWQTYLQQLRVPTLVITGQAKRGAIIDRAVEALICDLSPAIRVEHIERAGHCVRYAQPDAFVTAVRAFLGALDN